MIRPMTQTDLAPLFAIFRGIAAEGEMLAQISGELVDAYVVFKNLDEGESHE